VAEHLLSMLDCLTLSIQSPVIHTHTHTHTHTSIKTLNTEHRVSDNRHRTEFKKLIDVEISHSQDSNKLVHGILQNALDRSKAL
jgi:hypothetical protein